MPESLVCNETTPQATMPLIWTFYDYDWVNRSRNRGDLSCGIVDRCAFYLESLSVNDSGRLSSKVVRSFSRLGR